jgi:hypothetical protein
MVPRAPGVRLAAPLGCEPAELHAASQEPSPQSLVYVCRPCCGPPYGEQCDVAYVAPLRFHRANSGLG